MFYVCYVGCYISNRICDGSLRQSDTQEIIDLIHSYNNAPSEWGLSLSLSNFGLAKPAWTPRCIQPDGHLMKMVLMKMILYPWVVVFLIWWIFLWAIWRSEISHSCCIESKYCKGIQYGKFPCPKKPLHSVHLLMFLSKTYIRSSSLQIWITIFVSLWPRLPDTAVNFMTTQYYAFLYIPTIISIDWSYPYAVFVWDYWKPSGLLSSMLQLENRMEPLSRPS